MLDHLMILDPFQDTILPLGDWIEVVIQWVVDNFRPFFQAVRVPIALALAGIEDLLQAIPPLLFLLVMPLVIWQVTKPNVAILSFIGMLLVGLMGAWEEAMTTLALVITAVAFCAAVGIPLGIFSATNDRVEAVLRPMLDAMQTLPAFVYLVPVVMLFGIGEVPGVIVTFIFAVPPIIRLTNLGIRQVQEDVIEAALAFGSTPTQVLWEAQVPLAMKTILAGLNQSIMLSLSMVVIASLIGVEGLGQMVNRAIGRLDIALASTGGLGIVIVAIILDRVTQALGQPSRTPFLQRGPLGFILSLTRSQDTKTPSEA